MDPNSSRFTELSAWLTENGWVERPLGLEGETTFVVTREEIEHLVHLGREVFIRGGYYVPAHVYVGGEPTVETNGATIKWLEEHTG